VRLSALPGHHTSAHFADRCSGLIGRSAATHKFATVFAAIDPPPKIHKPASTTLESGTIETAGHGRVRPTMELTMSTASESRTPSQQKQGPREQLERLYREIGIPAVAAAAAQLARAERKPEPRQRELPAFLRDEMQAA
jgi:hypothetical protein